MGMPGNSVQVAYRFRLGDSEGLNAAFAGGDPAQNTSVSWELDTELDTTRRVRVEVEDDSGGNDITVTPQWEVQRNALGYNNVTTSSSVIKAVTSSQYNEGDNTSTSLLTGSAETHDGNGEGTEDGLSTAVTLNATSAEWELAFQVISTDVSGGDTLYLRLNGLDGYTVTATIEITEAITFAQTWAHALTDGPVIDGPTVGNGQLAADLGATPTIETDRIFCAYFVIESTGGDGTFTGQLERQLNAGSWADVTTSSTVVKALRSPSAADDTATEDNYGSSALTFVAGTVDSGGNGALTSISGLGNEHTQLGVYVYIPSGDVTNSGTVRLRLRNTHADGNPTYTQTLVITVDEVHALPGLVSVGEGHTDIETQSFVGPICDTNGNLYVFGEGGTEAADESTLDAFYPWCWKSTDGGLRWLPIGGPGPSAMRDLENWSIIRGAPDTTGEYWLGRSAGSGGEMDICIWYTSDHATLADSWSDRHR